MILKKMLMDNAGRYCSNCANCKRVENYSIYYAECESPRMSRTEYDFSIGKYRKFTFGYCHDVYATRRCKWKAVER